jgi:heme-based aerotactic transducer
MAIFLSDKWKWICEYSGLTDADLVLLHRYQILFEQNRQTVVDRFYVEIQKHPQLMEIVGQHSTIERLKKTQDVYFVSLASPTVDEDYIQSREKIGAVHARIGLTPDWFMSATNVYLKLFAELVQGLEEGFDLYQAFARRIVFDNAVILQQYDQMYRQSMIKMSHDLRTSINHVSSIAMQYAMSAEHLSRAQETIHESMQKLMAFTQSIEKISQVVMGMADQTHLLGLNAAIEAARAGDHGRGFAVVASEVRKLSEEVMSSSKEIQDSVRAIIQQVNGMSRQVATTLEITNDQTSFAQQLASLIQEVEAKTQQWHVESKV